MVDKEIYQQSTLLRLPKSPLPSPQRWMYCITSMRVRGTIHPALRRGSGLNIERWVWPGDEVVSRARRSPHAGDQQSVNTSIAAEKGLVYETMTGRITDDGVLAGKQVE